MPPKKLKLFFIVCFISLSSYAQSGTALYGGFDYFRDKGFGAKAYVDLNVGLQPFQWYFLAPELGFEYYTGSPDAVHFTSSEMELHSRFSSSNFSLAPKLRFGNREAAFVLIPQYNFGRIRAKGRLMVEDNRRWVMVEQQKVSAETSFWSFAIGVEGEFLDSDVIYFSLLLKYSMIDSEKILDQLSFEEREVNYAGGSSQGLGLGLRMYVDVFAFWN